MGRKDADVGELARALRAPAFANKDAGREPSGLDPVSPTTLVLSISEIKSYEHNPRRAENLEFPRLKDSIRTRRELTTPLTVTKRPGDDLYTIAAGGNSRLRALKELAEETGDNAFAFVTCRFVPWDSEHQVLTNHLIENDVRGNMLFGDKAQAVLEWRRLYEEDHPEQAPMSQRMLMDRLAESGYRIPLTLLNRLLCAAEQLMPHLPIAFQSGLHRSAIEQIIRLRSVALQYWNDTVAQAANTDMVPTFDDVFAEVCGERDCHCADWDHELFQGMLAVRMAEALAVDHKLVALDIDSLYHGYSVEPSKADPASPATDPQGLNSEWAFERAREVDAKRMQQSRARIGAAARAGTPIDEADTEEDREGAGTERGSLTAPAGLDATQLRESNFLAARRLAANHELDHYIRPAASGLGFFVEAPEPSAVAPEERDRPVGPGQGLVLNGLRSGLWWFLCLTADQLASSHLEAFGEAYPASWIVELFAGLPNRSPDTDPVAALNLLVGEPTAQSLVRDVLTNPALADEDLATLDELVRGCRALRRRAADGAFALWETK